MKKLIISAALFFAQNCFAGLLYNYSQLTLKDLDQMSKIVQDKIKESQKAGGDKSVPLKEAFQAVYSRSNEDDMIDKVVGPLKSALDEYDAYEHAVKSLTKEAIGALKNAKAFKPVIQVTYLIFLENIIAEMKPHSTDTFEKSVLTSIRDAKIEVTKEAERERKLRVMKDSVSPSELAKQILEATALPPPAATPAPAAAEPPVKK